MMSFYSNLKCSTSTKFLNQTQLLASFLSIRQSYLPIWHYVLKDKMISYFLLSSHPIQNLYLYTPPYSIKTTFTYVRKKFNLCSPFPLKYLFFLFLARWWCWLCYSPHNTVILSSQTIILSLSRKKHPCIIVFLAIGQFMCCFMFFFMLKTLIQIFFHLSIFFKKQSFNNET